MNTECVWDTEADGLLDTITKIHCISWKTATEKGTLTNYDEMVDFFDTAEKWDWVLIAHNCIAYDFKAVKRILNVDYKGKKIDTLPLAWYLDHQRLKFGLEEYGEDFGVPKPKITSWTDLTLEEYCHRCEQDVLINEKLWHRLKKKLQTLYS